MVLLSEAKAQIAQGVTTVVACSPANITFSAPVGASNISWTFGSYPPSSLSAGGFAVITPGNFTAVFTGTVGGSPLTFSVPVSVVSSPTANFSITQPLSDCAVKTVSLVNSSSGPSPIVSWNWVYGDGGANTFASGATHSYGYTTPGSYTVTLLVVDANGCDSQKTLGTINVINSPTAVIASNPSLLVGCLSTFSAAFSASNSLGGNLTYNWNFGNGQTSTVASPPPVTYTSQSNQYIVTLTVTTQGCSHSTSTFVTVSPATLSVTATPTVCLNAPFTTTVLSNQPFSLWNFGGPLFAFSTPAPNNPTISVPGFNTPGTHTVTVSAGQSPCIANPVTFTVFVETVTVNITSSTPTVSCASPFPISYTPQTTPNVNSYSWTAVSPGSVITTYTTPILNYLATGGSTNSFAVFVRPLTPTVSIIVTSNNGCKATSTLVLHKIERPAAWFNMSKMQGCAPLSVTLYDSSIVYNSCPITSYTWNNGASPPTIVTGTLPLPPASNTNIPNQTFTYTSPGTYSPFLIIQTASNFTNVGAGCTDISFLGTVTVVNPPNISFAAPSGTYCHNQPVQIVNTSPDINLVQHWHVSSDNGFFSGCVSDPNPSWKFTNTGTFNFTLTGYDHDCASSVTGGTVTINGPIGRTRYETTCVGNRYQVSFESAIEASSSATLNFGDGSSITYTGNPNPAAITGYTSTHTYTASGNYTASLVCANLVSGCSPYTQTFVVTVRNSQASMVNSPTVCLGFPIGFSGTGSIDVEVGCSRGYLWYVDGLPPVETTTPGFAANLQTVGIHTISLVVKDINGCMATASTTVRVSEAVPQFSLSTNSMCVNTGSVVITNQTATLPDAIAQYNWTFGDGSSSVTAASTISPHSYSIAGVPSTQYLITLTVTNVLGCKASISKPISIVKPGVFFTTQPSVFCVPLGGSSSVTLSPQIPYASYTIDYGAGNGTTTVNGGSSAYSYTTAGTYAIPITVSDNAGCVNSNTFFVTGVQTPTADFVFSSPNSTGGNNICSGQIVTFTNTTQPQLFSPIWNLGSGIVPSTNSIVSLFYASQTNSTVLITLTVNTGAPAFCTSAAQKSFTIYSYDADFLMSDSIVCNGNSLTFSFTPQTYGLGAWLWSFGDASSTTTLQASSTPTTPISHVYTNYTATAAGYASVSLIYWSGEMACREAKEKLIKVEKVLPAFKINNGILLNDTMHCLRLPDVFNDFSSVNSDTLFLQWRFGNGSTSTVKTPTYTYPAAGTYTAILIATNEHTCSDTASRIITIYPLPTAIIIPDKDGYCPNKYFSFQVIGSEGVTTVTMSPASAFSPSAIYTTSANIAAVQASLAGTGSFTTVVSDNNNCVSDPVDTSFVIVQPPVPVIWDTAVVVGEPVPILLSIPSDVTYTWSPIVQDLSCLACLNPISTSTVVIKYTLIMEDKLRCSQVISTYSILILPLTSVDLPTAFTPNGDGINDVIYADGWGILDLIYLRIYNRWGQLLFETSELSEGWDGTFEGKAQNMDTYIYQVSVQTYIDAEPLTKSSTFKLIR